MNRKVVHKEFWEFRIKDLTLLKKKKKKKKDKTLYNYLVINIAEILGKTIGCSIYKTVIEIKILLFKFNNTYNIR